MNGDRRSRIAGWKWRPPAVVMRALAQFVETGSTDNSDDRSTAVLTDHGLTGDMARRSGRAGREGSFDSLNRVIAA